MDFFRRFTILICAPAFDADDLEGHRLGEISTAIEHLGFQVVRARRVEDAEIVVQTDAAVGCMVVDWGKKGLDGKSAALINLMRRRGLEMPIVILVRRKRLEDIPVEVMDYIDGYIFLSEETPDFIARNLVSRLKRYAETLKTPFFGALVAPLTFVFGGGALVAVAALGGLVAGGAGFGTRLPAKTLAIAAAVIGVTGGIPLVYTRLTASSAGLITMAAEGAQVPPEWMINLNPGLIVFTMIFFAYLSSYVRPLTSIIIGMTVATAGSVLAGTATVGLVCLGGIAVFSIGEMLSSPKKMEYLATLAKKGQEGLFMGYANIPVAIGWIAGSYLAGSAYETGGDKANLARKYLVEHQGMEQVAADAIDRGETVNVLAQQLGKTGLEVQELLFTTYDPSALWWDIGAIGVASIVLMVAYDRINQWLRNRAASES